MGLRIHQLIASLSLAIAVGYLLTWGIAVLDSLSLFHHWQRVATLHSEPINTISIHVFTLYVQTTDGSVFAIEPSRNTAWTRIDSIRVTDRTNDTPQIVQQCDRTDRQFRWYALPPAHIRECLEAKTSFSTLSIIRDADEQLWYFETVATDFGAFGMFKATGWFTILSVYFFLVIRAIVLSDWWRLRLVRRKQDRNLEHAVQHAL